ncbi:DUF397 domain-containing protein [Streptomyces sp. NPDC047049]|uniref:DUF397 domain-containing protein n=1 Tax=Streptomyces sp. NPDC047049 TaxID=3156688 RepID=UPI0033C6D2EC
MREYDLSAARWRKSSYSDTNGGNCVEVAHDFPGAASWRKSSYSDGDGGNCVEVADDIPGIVPVRDSKAPDGRAIVFPATAWTAFVDAVKNPHFTGA